MSVASISGCYDLYGGASRRTDAGTLDRPVSDVSHADTSTVVDAGTDTGTDTGTVVDTGTVDRPVSDTGTDTGAVVDTGAGCDPGLSLCGAVCVNTQTSVSHCGGCGRLCAPGQQCRAGVCVGCPSGQHAVGDVCVANGAVPKQLFPISLGDVSELRPTLTWSLPEGYNGAAVELCRDRDCRDNIEFIVTRGTTARPTHDLSPRSVVFWRLRGANGATIDGQLSPVWLFHVPTQSATGASMPRDTSRNAHLDVNGDGYDDIAIGAPAAGPTGTNPGTVRVFLGRSGDVMPSSVLSGSVAAGAFGRVVTAVGDVNGDGYGDLAVGAPFATVNGMDEVGEVRVFHGSASGLVTAAATVLQGRARRGNFGRAIAGAGDIDGDGYADLVVGAPMVDVGPNDDAGEVRLYLGGAAGLSSRSTSTFSGVAQGEAFGWSLAGLGDIDSDGFFDVAVGAPYADLNGRTDVGRVSVFRGSASGLSSIVARSIEGRLERDNFGWSIANGGDLNGDGLAELIVGAPVADPGGLDASGSVAIYYGAVGAFGTPIVFAGAGRGDNFGWSVAGAGDVNGDGYGELIVGAPYATMSTGSTGLMSVFWGASSGVTRTGTGVSVAWGASVGDQLGSAVTGLGDVNGDGYFDLAAGAPGGDSSSHDDRGSVMVFWGTSAKNLAGRPTVLMGSSAGEKFGFSIASLAPALRNPMIPMIAMIAWGRSG